MWSEPSSGDFPVSARPLLGNNTTLWKEWTAQYQGNMCWVLWPVGEELGGEATGPFLASTECSTYPRDRGRVCGMCGTCGMWGGNSWIIDRQLDICYGFNMHPSAAPTLRSPSTGNRVPNLCINEVQWLEDFWGGISMGWEEEGGFPWCVLLYKRRVISSRSSLLHYTRRCMNLCWASQNLYYLNFSSL